jgi:transcriptional regulator with XRE-family HTH domain
MAAVWTAADLAALRDARAWARDGHACQVRLTAGLDVAEVARAVGVSRRRLWRWETGRTRPNGDPAVRWARLLRQLTRDGAAA